MAGAPQRLPSEDHPILASWLRIGPPIGQSRLITAKYFLQRLSFTSSTTSFVYATAAQQRMFVDRFCAAIRIYFYLGKATCCAVQPQANYPYFETSGFPAPCRMRVVPHFAYRQISLHWPAQGRKNMPDYTTQSLSHRDADRSRHCFCRNQVLACHSTR